MLTQLAKAVAAVQVWFKLLSWWGGLGWVGGGGCCLVGGWVDQMGMRLITITALLQLELN